MSAPPANQPPLIVQFLLSIIEILAAFALMPLLLLFIVAGLLYNILKHFLIPFLIVVAVIVVAFVYLLPQSPA